MSLCLDMWKKLKSTANKNITWSQDKVFKQVQKVLKYEKWQFSKINMIIFFSRIRIVIYPNFGWHHVKNVT